MNYTVNCDFFPINQAVSNNVTWFPQCIKEPHLAPSLYERWRCSYTNPEWRWSPHAVFKESSGTGQEGKPEMLQLGND